MFCQAFRFLAGKMNDCPMFGRSKVSSPHHSLVKLSQRSEMYEVGSFTESEIMNLLPVCIISPEPSTACRGQMADNARKKGRTRIIIAWQMPVA